MVLDNIKLKQIDKITCLSLVHFLPLREAHTCADGLARRAVKQNASLVTLAEPLRVWD